MSSTRNSMRNGLRTEIYHERQSQSLRAQQSWSKLNQNITLDMSGRLNNLGDIKSNMKSQSAGDTGDLPHSVIQSISGASLGDGSGALAPSLTSSKVDMGWASANEMNLPLLLRASGF